MTGGKAVVSVVIDDGCLASRKVPLVWFRSTIVNSTRDDLV